MSANFLDNSALLWKEVSGLPETTLLRLSLLRDLAQDVHTQRSHDLANPISVSRSLDSLVDRIDRLKGQTHLEGELTEFLAGRKKTRKPLRPILPALLDALGGAGKLDRHDRQWEQAITAEAAALGWGFWRLQASVELTAASHWHRELGRKLWPQGVVLFVEAGPRSEDPRYWAGLWTLTLHPRWSTPEQLAREMPLRSFVTGKSLSPSAPIWTRLFPPATG